MFILILLRLTIRVLAAFHQVIIMGILNTAGDQMLMGRQVTFRRSLVSLFGSSSALT